MTDLSKLSDAELQALYKPATPSADLSKMSDDDLQAAFAASKGTPITGPAGQNPAYHEATQDTPTGSFIPGNVLSGRGLPGGTPAQKAMDLGLAATPLSVGRGVGAIASAIQGSRDAAALAKVAPVVQNIMRNAPVGQASDVVLNNVSPQAKSLADYLAAGGKFAAKHFLEGLPLASAFSLVDYMKGGK